MWISRFSVIPAKAGIQKTRASLDPGFLLDDVLDQFSGALPVPRVSKPKSCLAIAQHSSPLTLLFPVAACLALLLALSSPCMGELAVRYEVRFEGIEDKALLENLHSASNTVAFKDKPPATVGLLGRRAEGDLPRLLQALKSNGYYGAEVDFAIDESAEPVQVTFHIKPGPAYPLQSVKIELTHEEAGVRSKLPSVGELKLAVGEAARARPIVDARDTILNRMRERGFPFVKVAEAEVVVDHSTREVSVSYVVDSGPAARFGETNVTGLQSVEESFVKTKLPWRKGDPFNAARFPELQNRLSETRLFSLIRITNGSELSEGLVPIQIEVKERKPRTVSLGVSYYTDEGPGAKVAWEHRNLLHGGERLNFDAKASGIGYEGKGTFRKPAFLRDDQSLLLNSRLARDDTDAFVSLNTELGLLVEREPRKGFRFGAGPAFRFARIDQQAGPDEQAQDFALLFFPAHLNHDTSDDLLNPSRGGRLALQLAPYQDTLDTDLRFIKAYGNYSRYYKVSEHPSLILAGRVAAGFMAGAERDAVPADVRFYAGGGGSVRGYPFQSVGPLFEDEPLGGRSLLELGVELRARVTEKLGFALFLDGGSAFEASFPDFGENVLWGTGIGVRYFTPVGPLRLDIGFPLERRESVDESFQIYVSIGQAF